MVTLLATTFPEIRRPRCHGTLSIVRTASKTAETTISVVCVEANRRHELLRLTKVGDPGHLLIYQKRSTTRLTRIEIVPANL
jgi:hypothetical protein